MGKNREIMFMFPAPKDTTALAQPKPTLDIVGSLSRTFGVGTINDVSYATFIPTKARMTFLHSQLIPEKRILLV